MAKLLLNANGKVLMKDDKVYKAPESTLKKLLDTTKTCYHLFYNYLGTSLEGIISYNDTENVTSMERMFYNCQNLITLPRMNTSNVINMNNIFADCRSAIEIPQLDMRKVTNANSAFYNCNTLIIVPELDTSNVTDMGSMFRRCLKLQTIPQLNTSNATSVIRMFDECNLLKRIDITSLDKISSTSSIIYFANNCYSLTKLIIRTMTVIPLLNTNSLNTCYHFTGYQHSTYNPDGLKDGRIYVPDNMVDQLKQATNWSEYADIIVPLSTLEE